MNEQEAPESPILPKTWYGTVVEVALNGGASLDVILLDTNTTGLLARFEETGDETFFPWAIIVSVWSHARKEGRP